MLNNGISVLSLADKRFVYVKIQHCSFLLNEEQYYRGFFKSVGLQEQ